MALASEPSPAWPADEVGSAPWDPLVLRSRLLGADRRITNWGGGNTSAKLDLPDPVTAEPLRVLWVKGSGGDLGTIDATGFARLVLGRVLGLEARYRGRAHEDEMQPLLEHCAFGPSTRAPSIDTPLHAFLPHAHVDHVHPDAVVAIATCRDAARLTEDVWEGAVGWLPWQRPGFDLGLRLRDAVRERPQLRGIVLGGHGLIAWADDARSCYENTLALVRRAERWIEAHSTRPAFGGVAVASLPEGQRRDAAVRLMPRLRGELSGAGPRVGHFSDEADVLEFCGSRSMRALAALGTACPDHFLRTRVRPLVLSSDPDADEGDIDRRLADYRADYAAYYARHRLPDLPPMRGSDPVVVLVPGVGMITFAEDKPSARIAGELFRHAIAAMRGANAVDEYVGLDEAEAFGVEYWSLEQAKLDRQPKPGGLRGRVALITGAAGGIGSATAERLLVDGACVLLSDVDEAPLAEKADGLRARFGADRVRSHAADVRDEGAVSVLFDALLGEYGGLDIVVTSAGVALAAAIVDTTLAQWTESLDVLARGNFLVCRAAMRVLKTQGMGGSIVVIGSKNGLAASPNASAYNAAKAATGHLARCLALEGAPLGVRVNCVNPDAVLEGSRIWQGEWRQARARSYGVEPHELGEHYRRRSLLGRNVLPSDVAEVVHFFASERSACTTGNLLNVDGGNAAAFPR